MGGSPDFNWLHAPGDMNHFNKDSGEIVQMQAPGFVWRHAVLPLCPRSWGLNAVFEAGKFNPVWPGTEHLLERNLCDLGACGMEGRLRQQCDL